MRLTASLIPLLLAGPALAAGDPIAAGKSLVEEDKLDLAKSLMEKAGERLVLPTDHVVAEVLEAGAANEAVEKIPDGKMGLDIGPKTVAAYEVVIAGAKTIIWNGPMGVFEMPAFAAGTRPSYRST